ncbi:MAG: A/G-specific adenine glycosylase [Candidatus Limnocylindria bacterium]
MAAHDSTPALRRVRRALRAWYATEHRDFPWRGTRDPYAVLVSEVMLQQTQASRVAERFPRFMARFPSVDVLATASSAEVLVEWNGLGYNRRALALQRDAATVARDGWPRTVDSLLMLDGIGPYTARAVASLAFGVPAGVVDTNVRRWLLRRFGVPDRPAALQELADRLAVPAGPDEVAAWTHASMEFGARVCRARSPRCDACPIASGCPSRGRAATIRVPRQAALRGSSRAYRGAVLALLTGAASRAMEELELRSALDGRETAIGPPLGDAGWQRVLAGLAADGLVHRSDGMVALGEATIEA